MQLLKHVALIVALAFPAIALAHGGGEHFMGTVKAVDEKGMTVATKDKKDVKVVFDHKTRFEKDGAPSDVKAVSVGERVVVHTAKKEGSGDVLAVLVKFGGKHANAEDEHTSSSRVVLSVTDQGFTPGRVRVKKDELVTLVITRKTDKTCATAISIPDYDIKRDLPLNEAVTITFTPNKAGELRYSCAMGMLGGVLSVE